MQVAVANLLETRKNCLRVIEGVSFEDICKIPQGFNNSIFWNVAHMVVTQQLLCYKLAALPMSISDELVEGFKKGSQPKASYSEQEWEQVLTLYKQLPLQLDVDLTKAIFKNYKEYPTSFGITLKSVEDAVRFNNIHEGLHIGYIMALKRVVSAA
ncbi:DinB family protein [Putridiphycobacter roseus]|uniref:DinB family protein n=1 Tax=Putridiphycobacter roseus TaxID=2219161 RepID=A0A2W1NRG1_9FLAO|nr:DinB family protein [Putridiphycobacter roseus]PZE18212.1 DinB family protein [Putridiphycobacter roseus]